MGWVTVPCSFLRVKVQNMKDPEVEVRKIERRMDQLYDWVSRWLENGYIHSWFTWLEWITLTSVLVSATITVSYSLAKIVLGLASIISIIFVTVTGFVGNSKLMIDVLEKNRNSDGIIFVVVICFTLLIPNALIYGMVGLIVSLVGS